VVASVYTHTEYTTMSVGKCKLLLCQKSAWTNGSHSCAQSVSIKSDPLVITDVLPFSLLSLLLLFPR
jgi:hypothetical protein